MSAIWGIIDFKKREIEQDKIKILREGFAGCKLDRIEEVKEQNVYMGCGIQYFTPEAEKEQLPFANDATIFNADVVLDNRKELLEALKYDIASKMPDGQLIMEYYRQFGRDSLNTMLGAYVFVDYDKDKNQVEIVSDAVGYRFVYYFMENDILYYASLMKPLEKLMAQHKVNKRWISDYIAQDNLNMFTECVETPVDGLYRIAPAHRMRITADKITQEQYWAPDAKRKKIRYKTDEQYKEHFLKLYQECVSCLLRSNGETAAFLSGGFDSTSLACLAAPELAKRGKKLYTFTSVPLHGYESEFEKKYIVDETQLVEKTAQLIPNLECTFMDLPDMNGWYDYDNYVKIAEIPYKSPQNMLWIYEGLKQAGEKGARIMLMGAFGNGTVSFDNAEPYVTWLFQRGRWLTLYREMNAFNQKFHYSRKVILKSTMKDALHIGISKATPEDIIGKSFVKRKFVDEQGSIRRLIDLNNWLEHGRSNYKAYMNAFITMDTIRHYGEFTQKNSLYTGVIVRDPTKDKRMIEFTRAIPYDQFTKNAVTRRLIREYMSGIVPTHVINERRQGRQSADLKVRILDKGDKIRQEWLQCFTAHMDSEVIDCRKALEYVKSHEIQQMTDFEIVRCIFTAKLLEYLDNFKKD